ncbi:MAG: hypothetical protein GY757_31360 [bacterium]|nr:hypothetical protein [bacterium]
MREGYQSNFQSYDEIFSGICQSQRLKNWLASFHYRSDKNGMPNGIWKPEYQPVGVLKVNDKK